MTAFSKATEVVRAAINGMCTWEDAGLELASRLEATTDEGEVAKLSAALSLLKNTGDKVGSIAQAAVQSGMGLYTFVWANAFVPSGSSSEHLLTPNTAAVVLLQVSEPLKRVLPNPVGSFHGSKRSS